MMDLKECPLRVVRVKLGLSQKELGILSGGSIQNVAGVETGVRQAIPAKVLLALKIHADVDPEKLENEFKHWYKQLIEKRKEEIIKKLKSKKK